MLTAVERITLALELLFGSADFCVSPTGYTAINPHIRAKVEKLIIAHPILERDITQVDSRLVASEIAELVKEFVRA